MEIKITQPEVPQLIKRTIQIECTASEWYWIKQRAGEAAEGVRNKRAVSPLGKDAQHAQWVAPIGFFEAVYRADVS